MNKQWNLSDKIMTPFDHELLTGEDVKEFIRKLKEDITYFNLPRRILVKYEEYLIKTIDRLAGDKLI